MEMPDKVGSAEEIQPSEEIPLPPAAEIERGGETYGYADWIDSDALPYVYMKTDKKWERNRDKKEVNSMIVWTDPENIVAEIVFDGLYDLRISPKESIWSTYSSVIEKGGDVEYGKFISKYFSDAYYCKYKEDGCVYIDINFLFYPEDYVNIRGDGEELGTFSYKNLENVPDGATMDEASFWKMAQSIYLGASQTGDEPYIPSEHMGTTTK